MRAMPVAVVALAWIATHTIPSCLGNNSGLDNDNVSAAVDKAREALRASGHEPALYEFEVGTPKALPPERSFRETAEVIARPTKPSASAYPLRIEVSWNDEIVEADNPKWILAPEQVSALQEYVLRAATAKGVEEYRELIRWFGSKDCEISLDERCRELREAGERNVNNVTWKNTSISVYEAGSEIFLWVCIGGQDRDTTEIPYEGSKFRVSRQVAEIAFKSGSKLKLTSVRR